MVYKLFFGVLTVLCFTEVVNGIRCSYYDYDRAYSKVTKYKYCDSGCCGDMNNRYCCYSNVGLIIGISIGSILLVVTVVTVFVVICCCCKKSRGQPGQVFQPASVTTTVHGMQTTPPTSFGFINGAYPQQIQTANMVPGTAQTWQEPPSVTTTTNNI